MFVAADAGPKDIPENFDVCIVGSGPAGMTVALKLAQAGQRVALIEAGALEYEDWSQDFYRGTVVGDEYYDLDNARLRMFGGSSNHWAGHCIPLDAEDFVARPDVPLSGWPIDASDVTPYLQEACDILEIPNDFAKETYAGSFMKTRFQWSPPVLFGEKYHDEISSSSNLVVFMETALVGLEHEGQQVSSAVVRKRGGDPFALKAGKFVLCMGGIENSRLLLWANEQSNRALIPNHEMIGRYWMEHPHAQLGEVLFSDVTEDFFYNDEATFSMTRPAQEQAGVLNAALQVEEYSYDRTKKLIADVACVAPSLGKRLFDALGKKLVCGARLHGQWEQIPVAGNRVTLGDELDDFGIPRTELLWQRGDIDRNTIIGTAFHFASELARTGKGRVRLADWIVQDLPFPDEGMMAIWHHMGGTRMSADPSQGLTDKDLRVHGLENLYIGGSSVFATGGYANPTLMIVQLSLRLADHLNSA